jgi:hypothetical protein
MESGLHRTQTLMRRMYREAGRLAGGQTAARECVLNAYRTSLKVVKYKSLGRRKYCHVLVTVDGDLDCMIGFIAHSLFNHS